jgi:hypothetical protein
MKYTTENLAIWPHKVETGHSIVPVFATDKHTYYQLRDVFNTYAARGMAALEIYEEYQSRMTKERLLEFLRAMSEELEKEKMSRTVMLDLVIKTRERTEFPIPTRELIRNMATVSYFDETESPYEYDQFYQREEKLPHWKECNVDDFFLGNRLSDLVPFPSISKKDFEAALRVMEAQDQVLVQKYPSIFTTNFKTAKSETS